MRSVIQKRYYGSVKVFWLDKALAAERLVRASRKLVSRRPEVEEVVLFGSLAEGRATAFSDADIIIITAGSVKRFIDRPDDYRPYFDGVGIDCDLFVYTREELLKGSGFAGRAASGGRRLAAGRGKGRKAAL